MYAPIPYDNKHDSIEQFFEEQRQKDPDYTQIGFTTRWPRSLEQQIIGIVRGYQRLRRLYNPIHGSNIDTKGTQNTQAEPAAKTGSVDEYL